MEETNQNEQVETVLKSDYDALQAQLTELQAKLPQEPTDAEIALQEREKALFDKEVNLTLKENGFEQYAQIVNVTNTEELQNVIDTLKEIHKQSQVNNAYVPNFATSTSQYEQAQNKKDAQGMISAKFSKLFSK